MNQFRILFYLFYIAFLPSLFINRLALAYERSACGMTDPLPAHDGAQADARPAASPAVKVPEPKDRLVQPSGTSNLERPAVPSTSTNNGHSQAIALPPLASSQTSSHAPTALQV